MKKSRLFPSAPVFATAVHYEIVPGTQPYYLTRALQAHADVPERMHKLMTQLQPTISEFPLDRCQKA